MTTPMSVGDQKWVALVEVGEEEREAAMEARYVELAALSEEERRNLLGEMARAEFSLPEAPLRKFVKSRMRVWLRMDSAVLKVVVPSYDAVMDRMPSTVAMRRIGLVQTLAREFSVEDQHRLREIVPHVFGDKQTRAAESTSADRNAVAAAPAVSRRRWWEVWKRG